MKQSAERRAQSAGVLALLLISFTAQAENRLALEPSIEITEVHDDNLNFSAEEPMRDQIRRITPTLALRFDSPRWSARGAYGVDSENYASHSDFDNSRARQRASLGIQYVRGPRMTLSLNSGYLDTNTLSELNGETGLASSRVRARQVSIGPAARFRFSPRLAAIASAASTTTNVINGIETQAQVQRLAVERRVTPRDLVTVAYEHSDLRFDGDGSAGPVRSHSLLAGWSRDLSARTHLLFSVGPRITNGSPTTDLAASMTHNWRFSTVALSVLRGQTTVIGQAGAVETQSVQARFTYKPSRRLSAYVSPAVIRSTQQELEADVYRMAFGARYTLTSLVDLDLAYTRDTQTGALDPLRAGADFSHAMLTLGFITRWSTSEQQRSGQAR